MARKLKCTVTGNWSYCSEDRWQKLVAKYGSEEKLRAEYVSRSGKKLSESKADVPDSFKNKVRCTITGELCYVSDKRMHALVKKAGSEEEVRKNYVSRVANRLRKQGKTDEEIVKMAKNGELPAPASAPGTRVKTPRKTSRKSKKVKGDVVIDDTPKADKDVSAFLKKDAPAVA
jgi:hypothetical protein